ncbi:hypothetical protein ITI46_31395 [Streptomyces oryzae]|uniref:Uncharacterized protein n=1 Tax=Streptomyces oryzae TaxID=1434886 RepID=A0ABS3XL40_9ACTN|nr:hypothetical protein [Streptomyces oryzae]
MLVVAGVGGGLMDVGVVVAGLGGVTWSGVLAGAGGDPAGGRAGVGVVELVGPVDPQMVLARVRLVAGVSGQLLVVIVGELRKDPKKGGLHVGLGAPGQHSAVVRYSGLPWEWLIGELAIRHPGMTTVLLDVATETDTWEAIQARGLPEAPGVGIFGRVVRHSGESKWRRRRGGKAPVEPAYLQECVRLWRAGGRMPFPELHERAAAVSGSTEHEQALFVATATATAFPAPAAHQPPGVDEAPTAYQPPVANHIQAGGQGQAHAQGQVQFPDQLQAQGQAPTADTPNGSQSAPFPVAPNGWEHHSRPDLPAEWQREDSHTLPVTEPVEQQPADLAQAAPEDAGVAQQSAAQPPVAHPAAASSAQPAPPAQPAAARSATAPPPAAGTPAVRPAAEDPHETILAAARAGRHQEAETLAASWQDAAERTEGPGSEGALHWLEVRADLARLAGAPARSCELWLLVARGRLELGEAESALEVEGAVDRAHHQWQCLEDDDMARELAPELVLLRRRVPGRQPGAVRLVEERAERLLGSVDQ